MRNIGQLIEEIIINRDYSHLHYSQYEDNDPKKKSEPIIKRKTILTSDYIKRLTCNIDSTTSILPPNCRYIEPLKRGHIVIIEEPPAYRTIQVEISMRYEVNELEKRGKLEEYGYKNFLSKNKSPYRFTLAFPYVIFILHFNEYNDLTYGQIFLRTQQMRGLSDILLKTPMLNINGSQHVCLGDKARGKYQSLYAGIENAIMVWWSAAFNIDYQENFIAYKNTPIINNYLEWEYFSKENPMFIYNVEWLKHKYNIMKTLNIVRENVSASSERRKIVYRDMTNIFSSPSDTGMEIKPTPRSRKKFKLYYDIAQTVYLDTNTILNVGDPLQMKNEETAFVYSFVGFIDGGDIKYVQMEKNGKLFFMKFNENFKEFIQKQIELYRFTQTVTLSNGIVIKPGNIISVKFEENNIYQKVEYIRRSRDINDQEIFEIKAGKDYYLSHKLDAKVFNTKEPELFGIKIEKGKKYLLIKEPDSLGALIPASEVNYHKIDVLSRENTLVAYFKNSGIGLTSEIHSMSLGTTRKMPMLLNMNNVKPISGIFRVGRNLYNLNRSDYSPLEYGIWGYNGCIFYESYYNLHNPRKEYYKDLIKDDTFSIPGADFDTTFTIGDKVVVANWETPIDILNVKTLQGFKINSENGNISFILLSKDGKLAEEEYINGKLASIRTGYIRRVTNNYDKLSVGTKIIAKESGIVCFPKKDVNIVVAIIIDGPYEPLVLCSNGCTLWYSTVVTKFQKITTKSKKWKTLQHVPIDISKIKFQAGDIINGRRDYKSDHGYLIFDPSTTRYLKVLPLRYYNSYPEHNSLDKYFAKDTIFDCIPNPRIGPVKQTELGTVTGYFDFHGGVIPDIHRRSTLKFINERGGIDV